MSSKRSTGIQRIKGNSRIVLSVWMIIACVAAMLLPAGLAGADISGVTITEYGGLTSGSGPAIIAAGPDGAMWFTENWGNRIGRIDMSGNVTEYSTGITAGSGPYGIAAGPDGAMWFTEQGGSRVGRITMAGAVTEYSAGITASSGPNYIAAGPDGAMWFTEYYGSRIGRIDMSGNVTEYSAGMSASSFPNGIAAGPDGAMWFSEGNGKRIGRIAMDGAITEYGGLTVWPEGIAAGPDGAMWFTQCGGGDEGIGRITMAGAVTEYDTGLTAGSEPFGIAAGPDGAVWFAEMNAGNGNRIGRIDMSGGITEYGTGITAASSPWGIAAGPDNAMWFPEINVDQVGRLEINFSVTYNGNTNTGGSVPVDGNVYHITDTVTVLGNTGSLVKTGYTFSGWNTAANGSGTSYSPENTFAIGSSNVTLYAQWTENTYSVTYNGNSNTGGSVPTDATSYHTGDTATVLGNTGTLVRTGYIFSGWNTAANGSGTSYTGGDTFAIGTSNVTLYAQWTARDYSVTYNGNTNTGGSVPVDGNVYHITDTVTVLGNTGSLVKTGYTFSGWNTAANGSGTSYSPNDTFAIGSSNVTLYAQWTENTYSVTYNGNSNTGGSVPTDATSYHTGDTATVLGNTGTLVRTGYTFSGWNTAANGSGTSYTGGDTFAIGTSNVTLYAQWTARDYSVTYNGNTNTGGSVPVDGTVYHITDTVTVLGNTGSLVKTGYTFSGWNTAANGSGTSYSPNDTFAIGSSNVTLYAQWTENTYSVTYNGNSNTGGSVPTDATSYHTGDTATVLGNTGSLVRTGYTFSGWNTAANGSGTSYTGGDTFAIGTSNVTLYAQWTENTYSVTYNGNSNTGGSVPTDATSYHTGDTATVLGNTGSLVKTGYTFSGWNTAANGSGTSYSPNDTFPIGSSNVTLYAQWTENTYSVTYNGNSNTGGSVPVDGNVYHITDSVTVLGNTGSLVKTGYTFSGWNTAANGSGTSYSPGNTFAIGSSNVTLYAQWKPVITASSGPNGSISPAGQVIVDYGADQTFSITPDGGYHVAEVLVDGVPVGPVYTYTFPAVVAGHTIEASFASNAPDTFIWYLPEGSTGGGMETWILMTNPTAEPITVDLEFDTDSGAVAPEALEGLTVPAESRISCDVTSFVTTYDLSTRVISYGTPVYSERATYGNGRAWGTTSNGSPSTATQWCSAEGSTSGGMQTYVLVQNPNDAPADVTLKFLTGSGEVQGPTETLPAHTRATFLANDWVDSYDVATEVTVTGGEVVCERATYGNGWAWGTCSTATPFASAQWYLPGMHTANSAWLLIANPNATAASVDVKYYTGGAMVQGPVVSVPARSRVTFNTGDTVPNAYVSAMITSEEAEVVCDWAEYNSDWNWGVSSLAALFPAPQALLTEGSTAGGINTFVTLFNPADAAATADLTLYTGSGKLAPAALQGLSVPARGVLTVYLNDYVSSYDVSVEVRADGPVVVKRMTSCPDSGWCTASSGLFSVI